MIVTMTDSITAEQYAAIAARKHPHKYRAEPVEVDGIKFPSKREARRWVQLVALRDAGVITDLERQVPYELVLHVKYVADFRYRAADGTLMVEDAKGVRTREYKRKAREMLKQHGIRVWEV